MPKVAPVRVKRSKPEIQKEFTKIAAEVDEARATANPKSEEMARARETQIRESVGSISIDGVVQKLSSIGLEISKSLADLSEKLVQEVDRLATVREAVVLETKELERLHKIDVAATALDQLIQDYRTQQSEFETEIAAQRAEWEKEQQAGAAAQKEFEDNLKKQRQREMEEYEYKKQLERKKAQDKYDEDVRLLEKKNKEKQEALEKSWQQREAAIHEREEEWARLNKEVDEFPLRLKQEIDKAAAGAVKATEDRLEREVLLIKKDGESDKRVAELQIQALQNTVSRQSAEIYMLHKQLEDAKRQVQDIAVKAIEGASGAKALSHVNQIAIEQAKTRGPQG
jgi:hypothetical protein